MIRLRRDMNPMQLRLLVLYKYMQVRAARAYNFEEGNKIHELTTVDVLIGAKERCGLLGCLIWWVCYKWKSLQVNESLWQHTIR